VNVDRRWWGTSVVRVRVLVAGLALLAAGGMVLGWGSRSRHIAANAAADTSSIHASSTPSAVQGSLQNAATPTLATIPGFLTPGAGVPSASSAAKVQARALLAGLPLMFEPNQGQANLDPSDPREQFVARGSGYSLLLGSEGAILTLRSALRSNPQSDPSVTRVESLRMKLAGSNPNARLTASDLLPSKSNYILGNDPAKWRNNVPQFARVHYENIYPGINLAFYGNQGSLEYDFQVAPGSDPAQAELEFEGAQRLELKDGALVIEAEGGAVRLDAPRVYQQLDGRQRQIEGSFVLRADDRVGFAIGAYDHSRELVIDPVLTYSTYFGGTGDEHFTQVAVDSLGDIYLAGSTTSTDLPSAGVFQTSLKGTQNIYIAKINPTLGAGGLVYVTYLGGSGVDYPVGIAVDGGSQPYVAGTTTSTDFPTSPTGYQTAPETGSPAGSQHVFVTVLNNLAEAPLQYSSYLSGNGVDIASGMTIDAKGYIYVTGTTTSVETVPTDQFPASNIPQAEPFQNISKAVGQAQFFVTKVNTAAVRDGSITYSTYFGGGNWFPATVGAPPVAVGGGIAVDVNQNIYFTGTTNYTYTGCAGCSTTDFPILSAYQPCLDQPPPVVITVNPPVCTPTAATASNSDAFVAKLNPNLAAGTSQLQWSSYIGGSLNDSGTGVAVDSGAVNVYISGTTNSQDVTTLTTFAGYQHCLDNPGIAAGVTCPVLTDPAPTDAFVARFANLVPTTTTPNLQLTYFSYLGGSANDAGLALTVDSANGAIITGWTVSPDFPVSPVGNSGPLGGQDAFVARLNTAAVVGQTTTATWANYYGGSATDEGTSIALDSNGAVYLAGDTNSTNLQLSKDLQGYKGGYDAFVTQLSPAGSLTITGSLTLGTDQVYISAGNQATFTYVITNQGPDLVTNITVSDDIRPTTTFVPLNFNSASVTAGTTCGGTTGISASCTIPSLQSGSTATVTIVLTPTPNSTGGSAVFNGGTVSVFSPANITPAQTSVSGKMSDFSLSVSPNNVTLPIAGTTANYQLQLTPTPVYGSNIGLTCSGLPTGPTTCNFSTTTVTLQGASPVAPTLSITTTARPIPLPTASLFSRHFYAIWLVPGLAVIGVGMGGDRRRRRVAGMLLLCAVLMIVVLQPACSSTTTQPPVSGTPAGTYPITITATSGSDTKSYPITLTVP